MGLSIPSYVTWSNVRRFGKMLPYYICDGSVVHQDALQRIVRGTKDATGKYVGGAGYKNFGSSLRSSLLETEAAYKGMLAEHGSFWKYAGNTFRQLPHELGSAWTTGKAAAQAASKSGVWGGIKSVGSALGKRIPLIGSVIYALTEIPNIARATADGGIVSGAVEAGKAVGKLAGFTAGAAIGQALCPIPFVGAIIGGMLGESLVSLFTGKSYTEQKEAIQQEALTEAGVGGQMDTGSTNPFANGLTEEQQAQLAQLDEMIRKDPQFNLSA